MPRNIIVSVNIGRYMLDSAAMEAHLVFGFMLIYKDMTHQPRR